MARSKKHRKPPTLTEDQIARMLANKAAEAGKKAAMMVLVNNYGVGFATIESDKGELAAVVLVSFEKDHMQAMMAYVKNHSNYLQVRMDTRREDTN